MKTAVSTEPENEVAAGQTVIDLPLGLLGFEPYKKYVLLSNPDEAPFMWLQMVDDPGQAFLVIPPATAIPNYQPELSNDDVQFLGLQRPEDAMLYNIVTLRGSGQATVNLKGPIVVNRRTRVGKQIIPLNAAAYELQRPLPTSA